MSHDTAYSLYSSDDDIRQQSQHPLAPPPADRAHYDSEGTHYQLPLCSQIEQVWRPYHERILLGMYRLNSRLKLRATVRPEAVVYDNEQFTITVSLTIKHHQPQHSATNSEDDRKSDGGPLVLINDIDSRTSSTSSLSVIKNITVRLSAMPDIADMLYAHTTVSTFVESDADAGVIRATTDSDHEHYPTIRDLRTQAGVDAFLLMSIPHDSLCRTDAAAHQA